MNCCRDAVPEHDAIAGTVLSLITLFYLQKWGALREGPQRRETHIIEAHISSQSVCCELGEVSKLFKDSLI